MDTRQKHTRKTTKRAKRRLEQVREPRSPQDLARAMFIQADQTEKFLGPRGEA